MLSAPFGGFGFFGSLYGGGGYAGYDYYILPVILAVVMASLQTMYAIGLYGFYRNYGSPISLAGAIALVAGAWVSAAIFVIIGLMNPPCLYDCQGAAPTSYYYYGFFSAAYSVPIGIGVIIAGLGVHNAARFHPDIKTMKNVGVFLTVGGLILAVVCLAFVGWAMAGVAEIVSLMLFRTALVPSGSTEVAAFSKSSVTSPSSSSLSSK